MLLVEDDELACELVYQYFQDCGFDVTPVFCATDSIANINNIEYNIVLLDINLPDFTGFEILKSIRSHISPPIIMTSARTEFELLSLLLKHENHAVKREELIHSISKISSPRSLDNHIKNIRKKLDDDGNKAIYLKTEYGVGYYLHVS